MSTEGSSKKFAVIKHRCYLHLHIDTKIYNETLKEDSISVDPGTLLKIIRQYSDKPNVFIVQICDYFEKSVIFENLYDCLSSNFRKVEDQLWPFLISIREKQKRSELIKNNNACKLITSLKPNEFVCVPGELFKKSSTSFDCIIRYIGPVDEFGTPGYYFVLELLNLDSGLSPQANDIPFVFRYGNENPDLSIITTADWIKPISDSKKYSTRDLLGRVRNVIGPICSVDAYSSLRKSKKTKSQEPTSQFYDTLDYGSSEAKIIKNEETESKMEINKKQSLYNTQNAGTYDTKLIQASAPQGILKHRTASLSDNIVKASPIMHLNDKDIIVIDKADIQESIKNESSLIILEGVKNDVDLVDILGSNWPGPAGDTGAMLNKKINQLPNNGTNSGFIPNGDSSRIQSLSKENVKSSKHRSLPYGEKKSFVNDLPVENSNINDTDHVPVKSTNLEFNKNNVMYESMEDIPDTSLGKGSMVVVTIPENPKELYGVIRWIGSQRDAQNVIVGVELEEINKNLGTTDGVYCNNRKFKCEEGRAIFVNAHQCTFDRRFMEVDGESGKLKTNRPRNTTSKMFGQTECPVVPGAVAPIKVFDSAELEAMCGKNKGIQGHHNSCYLDATLFSMFSFTSVFDSLLFRPPDKEDILDYTNVQKVLREEIVNPLRKNTYVRADRVMKLRQLLDKLSSVSGLTSEEKDPEEFLNSLLSQIMRVEPFLKLSSGQDAYFYQLFIEKDERLTFPTVQQLFEQSFHSSDIKLKEVPSCLIIQMPRFGKNYKMYPRILPSQVLDITDIIEDSPRQCSVCGKLAQFECQDCFGIIQAGMGLESTAFCSKCLDTAHMHVKRSNHTSKKLSIPQDYTNLAEHMSVPRLYMELFAVVCIETSHYVAFVKAGSGPDAPWCFFDSMADRKGEQNGYNIPEMIVVADVPSWLSDDGARIVNETSSNDKMLPEHAKRLFCDAYMCMYQSSDVMMYR